MKVSAVIYSRNEADLLRMCLPAVQGFDELIVCDMRSSDDTPAVARAAQARVVDVPDARVIEEVRQRGLDAATSEWVLFVDADEILPPSFSDHVRAMVNTAVQDGTVAFRLRYSNVAFGRTLEHTLRGSAKYSLLRRGFVSYPSPGRAHLPPDFDGPVSDAPGAVPAILHLNFRGVEQMTEKTLRYASDLEGERALLTPIGLIRELLRSTVFSGTWRDGYAGTAVATSAVVGRWYGALLGAERSGHLDPDLPPDELRKLEVASRVQAILVRVRDRLRDFVRSGGRPGHRRSPGRR